MTQAECNIKLQHLGHCLIIKPDIYDVKQLPENGNLFDQIRHANFKKTRTKVMQILYGSKTCFCQSGLFEDFIQLW